MMNASGSNWRAINAERAKWKALIHALTVGKRPDNALLFARILIVRGSSTRPDADGLASGGKAILDGLTEAGIIEDDSLENIGIPDYRWVKAKPGQGWVGVRVTGLTRSPYLGDGDIGNFTDNEAA
jgi:Holliday junction resolvase RusA-like endonuclease